MDYLNNTIRYLEEQNSELKAKLKRAEQLYKIITKQRESEQRDYLQRFHQEEINVIREIGENNQKSLKLQIKKLNQEIKELNLTVEQELDTIINLRQTIKHLQDDNTSFYDELILLREQIVDYESKKESQNQEFTKRYNFLQQQFKNRQSQVIERYMIKIQQKSDQYQEEVRKKTKFIDFLQNKLNTLEQQKQLLSEEVSKLVETLNSEQLRFSDKTKSINNQLAESKKENNSLKVYIKNIQMELVQMESQKNQEQNKAKKKDREVVELKGKQKEFQRSKNKQIQRQKSKNKLIKDNLSHQKKYLNDQIEKDKLKQRDFNNSKKMLINKIKEIESKYEHEKGARSLFDKTASKTIKKNMQTFQSISLDNSFSKESPSVSCFLKEDKHSGKQKLRKQLKIQTGSHISLLQLKDLGTPCFQSGKQKNIKKTIKIRK